VARRDDERTKTTREAYYPKFEIDPEVLRRGGAIRDELYPITVPPKWKTQTVVAPDNEDIKEEDVVAI
jgi:hypothetical protein